MRRVRPFLRFAGALAAAALVLALIPTDLGAQALPPDVAKAFKFRAIGPTRQSGRFVDFAVPAQEPNTIYAATGSGGLWKSVNNGISWESDLRQPAGHLDRRHRRGRHRSEHRLGRHRRAHLVAQHLLGRRRLQVDRRRQDVDEHGARRTATTSAASSSTRRTRTSSTWRRSAISTRRTTSAASTRRSTAARRGRSRSRSRSTAAMVGAADLVMDPKNPKILYAATYDKERQPWTFNLGGPGSGIYKTIDAGKTWTKLGGGLPGGMLGRIGLDVYAKNPLILYANIENANKPGMSDADRLKELRDGKSSDGMIGEEVYRSDDGGQDLEEGQPRQAEDRRRPRLLLHADPRRSERREPRLRADRRRHALDRRRQDLGVAVPLRRRQPRAVDRPGELEPHDPRLRPRHGHHLRRRQELVPPGRTAARAVLRGRLRHACAVQRRRRPAGQRLGARAQHASAAAAGSRSRTGRRSAAATASTTSSTRSRTATSTTSRSSARSRAIDLYTGEAKNITSRDQTLRFNWNAPILVSPHDSNVVYHAANKLLKSTNRGETWTEISPDLTTNDKAKLPTGKGGDGNIQYCTITTIDESPLVRDLLWVGTDDGNVWVTKDGGKTWTKLNDKITGNPGYWVSRVVASSHAPGTAYVTLHRPPQRRLPRVRLQDDRLRPDVDVDRRQPAGEVGQRHPRGSVQPEPAVRRHGLRASTSTIDGGKTWQEMKNGLPTQPVHDLKIHPREHDLIVATHGRGIFITDISALEEISDKTLAQDFYLFDVESKVKWIVRRGERVGVDQLQRRERAERRDDQLLPEGARRRVT